MVTTGQGKGLFLLIGFIPFVPWRHLENRDGITDIEVSPHLTLCRFFSIEKYHEDQAKSSSVMPRCDAYLNSGERCLTNGDLKARLAAMVSAGSRQRKMAPNSMSFPMRTSTGRQARW